MKKFKKFLIGLLVFLVIFSIVGLILPGKAHIERSIDIKAPADKIFPLVGTVKNWELWSPWLKMDPNMQITYFGPESGTGAGYSWVGDKWTVGTGKITLGEYVEFQKIETIMNFMEDEPNTIGGFSFVPSGEGTKVSWYVDIDTKQSGGISHVTGGWSKLFMDFIMKRHFDDGLANLKTEAEKI